MDQTENKTTEAGATTEAKSTIDQVLVDKLNNEMEALVAEQKNKVYPIKLETDAVLGGLLDFIDNKASWKNMEALGIIEVSKVLNEERSKGLKSGNIFLKSLPIQAISFFLSKVEDKGIAGAQKHIQFVKPIDDGLKLIKADNDALNKLQSELAAAENGIGIEPAPEK